MQLEHSKWCVNHTALKERVLVQSFQTLKALKRWIIAVYVIIICNNNFNKILRYYVPPSFFLFDFLIQESPIRVYKYYTVLLGRIVNLKTAMPTAETRRVNLLPSLEFSSHRATLVYNLTEIPTTPIAAGSHLLLSQQMVECNIQSELTPPCGVAGC